MRAVGYHRTQPATVCRPFTRYSMLRVGGSTAVYPLPCRMTSTKAPTTSEALARRAAALCLELKAADVVVLNLAGVTDMSDFFVIASGTSDTHVRSIAQHVMEKLGSEGTRVHHEEGVSQGRWALLDYVDIVVHVFHPTLRQFYQLERLWGDAEVIQIEA